MQIRIATKDDINEICEISHEVSQYHSKHVPQIFVNPKHLINIDKFWLSLIDEEESIIFLAEEQNIPVGMITAKITESNSIPFIRPLKICRIGTIAVKKKNQGLGIGKLLLMEVENWAKEKKASEVRLEVMNFNDIAIKFYQKNKFDTYSSIMRKTIT